MENVSRELSFTSPSRIGFCASEIEKLSRSQIERVSRRQVENTFDFLYIYSRIDFCASEMETPLGTDRKVLSIYYRVVVSSIK